MLKLIFMGWKDSTLSSLMYSPSAPMAVVLGNSGRGRPCTFAAMATAARYPEAVDSTYPSTPVICPAKATKWLRRSA